MMGWNGSPRSIEYGHNKIKTMNYNRQQITKMVKEYELDKDCGFVDCFENWLKAYERTEEVRRRALTRCKDYEIFDHECDELP